MAPPRHVRFLFWVISTLAMGASLVRGDDTPLTPNQTIRLPAKLVHPVISPRGDYLYWLNQSEGKLQRASLADNRLDARAVKVAEGARDFCLSPDGSTAYVAATTHQDSLFRPRDEQSGTVQSINLADLTLTASFEVQADLLELVADAQGFLYATSGSGQRGKIHKIDPGQQKVLFGFGEIYAGSNLRITADHKRLYLANNGLTPGNMSATHVPTDVMNSRSPVDSRYHGEYPLGGAFDLTPDGKYAVNRHGTVLQLDSAKGADLLFVTTVAANVGTVCDPAGGKLWALQADGRLLTYAYPALTLEKSEPLLSPGRALAYDAAHQTLWVFWTDNAGGIGGLDAYNLASPATYPSPIAVERKIIAAQPTPSAAATAPTRSTNPRAAYNDKVVLGLLALCGLLLIASIIFSHPDWPVPGGIKFIGWFIWFQVLLILSVLVVVGMGGATEPSLYFARVVMGVPAFLGALAWGILRGSKICYLINATLQIGIVILSLYVGSKPGLLAGVMVVAVLYYGRKEWDNLT